MICSKLEVVHVVLSVLLLMSNVSSSFLLIKLTLSRIDIKFFMLTGFESTMSYGPFLFTVVIGCFRLFSVVCGCLRLFAVVCGCLRLFSDVYGCFYADSDQ